MKTLRALKFIVIVSICLAFNSTSFAKDFFVPRKPEHETLKNGLEVYFLENHDLPVVDMMLYIRGGTVYDPMGKEGLSALTMQSLRLGGTKTFLPNEVEELLEQVAATLEFGAQPEYFTGGLSLLKKDLSIGMDLLFSLLREPTFKEDRFNLVKAHAIENLKRESEDPFSYASKEFAKMVYRNDGSVSENPWGRYSSPDVLKGISRDEAITYFKKMICPERLVFAVSGNISKKELIENFEKRTKDWPACSVPLPKVAALKNHWEPVAKVFTRPDLTQSTIYVGHLGESRFNPDKYALQVMNFLLGGGGALNSRMGDEIRSNAGKAYVVYSDFGFGKERGLFRAIAQTALQNTAWVTEKMKEMVGALSKSQKDDSVTLEEVDRAKKGIVRSLMFDFETDFSQVKELTRFALLGYPENYLEVFQQKVKSVSVSDVKDVAKKYLKPESLSTLILTSPQQDVSFLKNAVIEPVK